MIQSVFVHTRPRTKENKRNGLMVVPFFNWELEINICSCWDFSFSVSAYSCLEGQTYCLDMLIFFSIVGGILGKFSLRCSGTWISHCIKPNVEPYFLQSFFPIRGLYIENDNLNRCFTVVSKFHSYQHLPCRFSTIP